MRRPVLLTSASVAKRRVRFLLLVLFVDTGVGVVFVVRVNGGSVGAGTYDGDSSSWTFITLG